MQGGRSINLKTKAMKTTKILAMLAIFMAPGLSAVSCSETEEMVEAVDLRYDADDSYSLTASGADEISFEVKSDHPWEVYSYHPDWCTINPSSGDPGEKYTVTVQYEDNDNLDARVDTLVIRSDYWIGKWVTVTQDGNAYMTVSDKDLVLGTEGGSEEFSISSNQKWTAVVTSGAGWLSLSGHTSGEGDGQVSIRSEANTGIMRYATVTVYDRNGDEAAHVDVVQDGVQLEPELSELRAYYNDSRIELKVNANTEWTVYKDDDRAEWYRFESVSFDGDGTLAILLDENSGTAMRQSTFTLSTVTDDGTEPVTVMVTLKQACNTVERIYFKDNPSGWTASQGTPSITEDGITFAGRSRYNKASMSPGIYTFRIRHDTADAFSTVFFIFGDQEIRWHLDAASGKTVITLNPAYGGLSNTSVQFDSSQENEVTMVMSEAENGFIRLEWLLNGEKVTELPTTEGVLSKALWDSGMTLTIGANTGTVTFLWYEYAAPVIWE